MLQVAYISGTEPKIKRVTARQRLHQEALAVLAARRIHDREKALKMFAKEREEIEQLKKQLASITGN